MVSADITQGVRAVALEKELETYKTKLLELMANEGKFVLIHKTEVVDTFDTYADAKLLNCLNSLLAL